MRKLCSPGATNNERISLEVPQAPFSNSPGEIIAAVTYTSLSASRGSNVLGDQAKKFGFSMSSKAVPWKAEGWALRTLRGSDPTI